MAASPAGPRGDVTMSPQERADPSNGIWLCRNCGTIIDDAPSAFPVEGLRAWKIHAEAAAARDASALTDQIAEILAELDEAHDRLIGFTKKWEAGEPVTDWSHFQESAQAMVSYSLQRRSAYQGDVAPLVTAVITKSETVLGEGDPRVQATKGEALTGPTNYIGMRMLADQLQVLRVALSLR
jgi:hypothetical protein